MTAVPASNFSFASATVMRVKGSLGLRMAMFATISREV